MGLWFIEYAMKKLSTASKSKVDYTIINVHIDRISKEEVALNDSKPLKEITHLAECYKNDSLYTHNVFNKNEYLAKINTMILRNLNNSQFSIKLLCSELAISNSQLYRKISKLTGKSIVGYINSFRLTMALELIGQGENATIKEIAFKVGYNDNLYFSRAFKKEFGHPPSAYFIKQN